ncbi:MAG: holo-ACP synthase [Deltaproteobacteria bacterium]|jgi:holo-[acyl-carrier protein] synthase|nr:holo-ACP synthase [Deltaproteobacteria bacterium]
MIIGIGIDLIDVRRFESIIYRWGNRFLKRLFTDREIKYCNTKKHPAQRFATRYAAKQAFMKALFPRGEKGIHFKDIEVDQKNNRPVVNLYGKAKGSAEKADIKNTHLMLSHDGDYGIANVVIEG